MEEFEVIIIGAGPGGYVAAIRAAQLGMKVAVIEATHLGGICLNWGCIPTKALLRSAEVYTQMKHAEEFGFKVEKLSFDLAKIIGRSREVAAKLSGGIKHLLKKNKVTHIEGFGKLAGKGLVEVKDASGKATKYKAKNIIIATGARARALPGLEADEQLVWTYKKAMTPDIMPKKLLVVGSGAIGIEFASFYNALGAEVTVVEVMDRILPVEDREISDLARKAFEKRGIKFLTKATVKAIKKGKDSIEATIDVEGKAETIKADRAIMAVGISPNTQNIGLEGTKVKMDRGHIITGKYLETDEPGVFAIGDVTGGPWLAHKASHEAIICVEHIAGLKPHALIKENIPGCTYSSPQIASIGLTEEKAREQGHELKVGRFPYMANGKAIAMGETEGMIKTIYCAKTGELLGAHMIGAEVTEMIQGFAVAKTGELTELDIIHTIFPHPTMSEMMHEASLDALKRAIHV